MASEISVKIKATNTGGSAFADATKDADALNATISDLKGSLAGFDGQARAVKDDLTKLDGGIRQNKQSLRDLATAFADASKESDKLDIQAKMADIEKALNVQLKAKKIKLDELVEIDTNSHGTRISLDKLLKVDESEKKRWGAKLIDSIGQGIQSGSSALDGPLSKTGAQWGLTIGAALGPTLLQAAGGFISAGAGAGGLGGAVALAIRSDTELQAAGKDLGNRLLGGLTQAAHTSMYEPIKATLKALTGDVDTITDQWAAAFEKLAPSLTPFVTSVVGTITDLSGVIADIAGDSGPLLAALADGFKTLGASAGGLLKTLTDDVDGNAEAMTKFFNGTAAVIDLLGDFIEIQRAVNGTLDPFLKYLAPAGPMLDAIGVALSSASDGAHMFKAANGETAEASEEATAQINAERSALDGLAEALKAQTDPAFALIDAQQQLGDAQKAYNKAVKDHGKNSEQAREATLGLAKASLSMEAAAEKAAGTFDGQVSPALRATMRAAGLTDKQINGVAASFKNARAAGEKFEDKYEASIKAMGVAKTIADISKATAAARNFAKDYYARLSVAFSAGGAQKALRGQAHGGIAGQAASGATSSGMTWVGEQGPELVDLPAGSRVWSAADSSRSNTSARGHGDSPRGPLLVRLMLDHRQLVELMVDNLQDYVANQGGGDINILGGIAFR